MGVDLGMGGAFAFMGNQFRLEVDDSEYFIDILLYHRRLKCLIAVAQYRITSTLPKNLQKELPAPEQIRALLDDMDKA